MQPNSAQQFQRARNQLLTMKALQEKFPTKKSLYNWMLDDGYLLPGIRYCDLKFLQNILADKQSYMHQRQGQKFQTEPEGKELSAKALHAKVLENELLKRYLPSEKRVADQRFLWTLIHNLDETFSRDLMAEVNRNRSMSHAMQSKNEFTAVQNEALARLQQTLTLTAIKKPKFAGKTFRIQKPDRKAPKRKPALPLLAKSRLVLMGKEFKTPTKDDDSEQMNTTRTGTRHNQESSAHHLLDQESHDGIYVSQFGNSTMDDKSH